MLKKVLILNIILIFFFQKGFSQNLVLNPSFEENTGNPGFQSCLTNVNSWTLIKVYAQYLNNKGDNYVTSFYIQQAPHSGDAHVLVELVDEDKKETGTLIQGELSEPLKAGKCYYAEAYISLVDDCFNYTSNFEFHFSDTTFSGNILNKYYQMLKPAVSNPLDSFITEKENWVKICGIFKAKGGESYILIGNTQKIATSKKINSITWAADYFLDDVSVVELSFCPDEEFAVDSVMIFKNLNFETGKSVILKSSFEELDKMVTYLNLFQEFNIEISGHTDNVGTSEFNLKLSEARAKAVCVYLISKGISSERLTSTGYGDTRPIADNSTDNGKALNRRVEFIITKK